VEPIGIEPMT